MGLHAIRLYLEPDPGSVYTVTCPRNGKQTGPVFLEWIRSQGNDSEYGPVRSMGRNRICVSWK